MTGAALQGLHTAVLGRRAIYLEETDSTNRYLKEAGESLPHGTLCYTGRQTSGRGRLGRDWTAPDGAALAMSVLLRGVRTPIGAGCRWYAASPWPRRWTAWLESGRGCPSG